MAFKKPKKGTYPAYFEKYVNKVKGDVVTVLKEQQKEIKDLLKDIDKEQLEYAYAPGKWTLKESLVHVIDTEQIFAFRALAIARGERKNLPGFDQDKYIKNANLEKISKKQIGDNFVSIRKSSMFLFDTFGPEDWVRKGKASGNEITPQAFPWMIAGHTIHHMNIIKKKYLK